MNRVVGLLLSGAVLAGSLVSCASSPKSRYEVDWRALEKTEAFSAPMAFLPEMDVYSLRIPLLNQLSAYEEYSDDNPKVRTTYTTAHAGLDLGNGLAIDFVGNIYLDVLKLLQIDKSRGFDVRSGALHLWRDDTGMKYSTATAKDQPVELTETSEYIAGRLGRTGYEKKDNLYKFSGTTPLQTGYEATEDGNFITLTARYMRKKSLTFTRSGSSVDLAGRYTIKKTGDTYVITCNEISGIPVYSLYVADRALYFCEGDRVRKRIEIRPDMILVNGKKTITYSVQSGG